MTQFNSCLLFLIKLLKTCETRISRKQSDFGGFQSDFGGMYRIIKLVVIIILNSMYFYIFHDAFFFKVGSNLNCQFSHLHKGKERLLFLCHYHYYCCHYLWLANKSKRGNTRTALVTMIKKH